jgi:hypothetical protein
MTIESLDQYQDFVLGLLRFHLGNGLSTPPSRGRCAYGEVDLFLITELGAFPVRLRHLP